MVFVLIVVLAVIDAVAFSWWINKNQKIPHGWKKVIPFGWLLYLLKV